MPRSANSIISCFRIQSAFFICILIMLFITMDVRAQSGRRPPKSNAPLPQPESTTVPTTNSKPVLQDISLKVVSDISQTLYLQFPFPERMQAWVIDRLKKSLLLEVTSGASLNRRDAIKSAKSEVKTFTVLLELEENLASAASSSSGSKAKNSNISINYYVYAPGTGKVKLNGRIFLNSQQSSLGRLGRVCYPDVYEDDYILLESSIEVANRIMSAFDIPAPPVCSIR